MLDSLRTSSDSKTTKEDDVMNLKAYENAKKIRKKDRPKVSNNKFVDVYTGVKVPNLLKEYDVIGFDTSLVSYKIELTRLLVDTYL